jgi:hypothetical protein
MNDTQPETDMNHIQAPRNKPSGLSILNLFLILALAGIGFLAIKAQEDTFKRMLESDMYDRIGVPTVDFTVSHVQAISDGYMLTQAEMEQHLNGIKFSGQIINTRSVMVKTLTCILLVAGQERQFTISQISPAHSTKFEVYVPDLDPASVGEARIFVTSAMVMYTPD